MIRLFGPASHFMECAILRFVQYLPAFDCSDSVRPVFALLLLFQFLPLWVTVVVFIVPIPVLCIGHCFGRIPTPCGFESSAFPSPPKKSSRTARKIFCVPPEMQTLVLGVVSLAFGCPNFKGRNGELHLCTKTRFNSSGIWGRTQSTKLLSRRAAHSLCFHSRHRARGRMRTKNGNGKWNGTA